MEGGQVIVSGVAYAREPSALWRRVGPRVVVLAPGKAQPTVLAGTAAVTWDLLEEPRSMDRLVELLAELFAVDEQTIADQLEPFLADLVTSGALVVR